MATITGEQGASITQQLSQYLIDNAGNLDVTSIASILNSALPSSQQIGVASGNVVTQGIYKKFGQFDKILNKIEVVTEGLWSDGNGSLTTAFTGSNVNIAGHSGSAASKYYHNVYLSDADTGPGAPVEFAVAYGHKYGSGSVQLAQSDDAVIPTKATYSQYRIILNDNFEGNEDDFFTFYDGPIEDAYSSPEIYVINLSRARYRQQADPGNITLTLSGSNGIFQFIDDSGKKFSDKAGKAGTVFNIVSGSNNIGTTAAATIHTPTGSNGQGFGKFYPKSGIIILNPAALEIEMGASIAPNRSSNPVNETYNQVKLFQAIKDGGNFELRRTEMVSTEHFFVRATNREFNFSNNPTYISGDEGDFAEPSFEETPITYITTVGLYNDANELLAVAKTSQPIAKSFDKEVLIKIKLSF